MSTSIKKIHILQIATSIALFMMIVLPFMSFAQNTGQTTSSPLVPCSNTAPIATDGTIGTVPSNQQCDFKALLTLVNNVVQFILFKMLVPIAAIMFCYCGFLMVTSSGESSRKTKAKNIFSNVIWGLVIAIAAWLIIETILKVLGFDGSLVGF